MEALSCRSAGEYRSCGALHCSHSCGGNFQGCIQPYADAEQEEPELGSNPERWVTYGVRTSSRYPMMIDFTRPLFREDDLEKIGLPWMDSSHTESEDVRETARKIATRTEVEGSYGAFSAAAKLTTEHMNSNEVKKFRLDRRTEACRYKVTLTNPYPYRMLTENAREFLLQETPERIVETYGEFYTNEIWLGGALQVTNVVEMTTSDTKTSLSASVRASYGLGNSVSATAEGNVDTRVYQGNTTISSQWHAKGGNTAIWLGLHANDSNKEEIQQRWLDSFTDSNLYPAWQRLVPIWDLLRDLDNNKAGQLESYLKAKWAAENSSIVDGQPRPDLRLYCVGLENILYYAHIREGRNVPGWAGRGRFCWWAFPAGAGPAGTQTYCQGKSDGFYSHLRIGYGLPSWAWRDSFCFDAWTDASWNLGLNVYCNGWTDGYYSVLVNNRSVPSWASMGRFCFKAYPEAY